MPSHATRRIIVATFACAAIIAPAAAGHTAAASTTSTTADSNTVTWPANSVATNPIGANPALDPNSASIVKHLTDWTSSQTAAGRATWYTYSGPETSNPLVKASASDPTWNIVVADAAGHVDTVKSSYLTHIHAPSDVANHIATGPDHQLAIYGVDGEIDLWEATVDASTHTIHAQNGGRIPNPAADPGISFPVNGAYNSASGLSQEALTITPQEMKQAIATGGWIHHPLMMAMPGVFENGRVSKPAIAADNWSSGIAKTSTNLSIGQRLQLNPALDVSKLNQPAYTKVVERTLQHMGAILTDSTSQPSDTTGGIFNVALENPADFTSKGQANPWTAIYASDNNTNWSGRTEDWTMFTGCYGHCDVLPVNQFRVLAEDYMAPASTPAPTPTPTPTPSSPAPTPTPSSPASTVGTTSSWAGAETNTTGLRSDDHVKFIVNSPTITPAMVGKTIVFNATGKTGIGTVDATSLGIHFNDASGWHEAKLSGSPIVTGATAGVKTPITQAMVGHQVQLYGHVATTQGKGTVIPVTGQVFIGSSTWNTTTSYTLAG